MEGKKPTEESLFSFLKITHPEQMEEWNSARLLCINGDENTISSREDQCSELPTLSGKNCFCQEIMNRNLEQDLFIYAVFVGREGKV